MLIKSKIIFDLRRFQPEFSIGFSAAEKLTENENHKWTENVSNSNQDQDSLGPWKGGRDGHIVTRVSIYKRGFMQTFWGNWPIRWQKTLRHVVESPSLEGGVVYHERITKKHPQWQILYLSILSCWPIEVIK